MDTLEEGIPVVDIRNHADYQSTHIPGSINIPDVWNENVETWIGTLFKPGDKFYLAGYDAESLLKYLHRVAKIYYEPFVAGLKVITENDMTESAFQLDINSFRKNPHAYTLLDVRSYREVHDLGQFFDNAMVVPLNELPGRINEIPVDKPVVVYCAGGYRSDIAESIIRSKRPELEVASLGTYVKEFKSQ